MTDVDRLTTDLALTGVPWDKPRWERFVKDLSPDEQRLEVQMLTDSTEPPPKDAWIAALKVLLAVVEAVPTIAADVTGVGTAVTTIEAAVAGL